jgi:hypothetical protein
MDPSSSQWTLLACAFCLVAAAYVRPRLAALLTRTLLGRLASMVALFLLASHHKVWGIVAFVVWLLLWMLSKRYSYLWGEIVEKAYAANTAEWYGEGNLDMQIARHGPPKAHIEIAGYPELRRVTVPV